MDKPPTFAQRRALLIGWAACLPTPLLATSPAQLETGLSSGDRPSEEFPYVQTPERVVRRMLQLADVNERDILWDLGSGDGRIVIAAARDFRARAVGYEIDRSLIELSRRNARRAGVADRAVFIERDLWSLNFSAPSVVTLYLLPEFNLRLRPLLLAQMKPGSRIVSHEWDMGDWPADETLIVYNEEKPHGTSREHKVLLWHVPAQISGRWQVKIERSGRPIDFQLDITQNYQRLSVRPERGVVRWAKLTGRKLELAWRENETTQQGERFILRGEVQERRGRSQWHGEAIAEAASIREHDARPLSFQAVRLAS